MNIRRRITMIVIIIILILVATGCVLLPRFMIAPNIKSATKTLVEFESEVQKLIDFKTPPGLVISVVKDGRSVYQKNFGSGLHEAPASDKIFHWWSVTKIFTAVSILQLAEKKLIDLDTPITDYLPEFDFTADKKNDKKTRVTIRHLLSHSSGLGDAMPEMMFWIHYSASEHKSQTEFLKGIWHKYNTLKYDPGTEGRYSNLGYVLLGVLIEKVSGLAYEDYIGKNILEPLKMTHSGFSYSDEMRANMIHGSHPIDAMGIMASFNMDMKRAIYDTKDFTWWFNEVYTDYTPPSGLLASTDDMSRFVLAMLEKENNVLLTAASREIMTKDVIAVKESPAPVDGLRLGLGWFVMKLDEKGTRTAVLHGGNGVSQCALIGLVPGEGLGIIIVANSTYMGTDFGISIFNMLVNIDWNIVK